MAYATWHWRSYNVLRRIVGVAWALGGAAFVISGLALLLGLRNPGERVSAGVAMTYVLIGLPVAAIGVRLCRARTYRPDLGDASWWAGKAGRYDPPARRAGEPRSWWTGDPPQG